MKEASLYQRIENLERDGAPLSDRLKETYDQVVEKTRNEAIAKYMLVLQEIWNAKLSIKQKDLLVDKLDSVSEEVIKIRISDLFYNPDTYKFALHDDYEIFNLIDVGRHDRVICGQVLPNGQVVVGMENAISIRSTSKDDDKENTIVLPDLYAIHATADGIYAGDAGELDVITKENGQFNGDDLKTFTDVYRGNICKIRKTKDGRIISAGDYLNIAEQRGSTWKNYHFFEVKAEQSGASYINDFDFLDDGRVVTISSGKVLLWDKSLDGTYEVAFENEANWWTLFKVTDQLLLIGSGAGTISYLRLANDVWEEEVILGGGQQRGGVMSLYSSDDKILAGFDKGEIILLQRLNGIDWEETELSGKSDSVNALQVLPNGDFVSFGEKGKIEFWSKKVDENSSTE